jgi:hypothetical protein
VLAQHFPAGAGEPVAVIGKAAAAAQLASALRGDRMWWPSRLARPSGQVTGAPSTPVTTGHR